MKDSIQKMHLSKHFDALGWYVQLEVPVYLKGGVQEESKLITDIDILGLRMGVNYRWDAVIGDCKTLRSASPANRVLWVKGLMDQFSASSGFIILRRKRPIELDHKLLAASMGIILLDEDQFPRYDRATVYPAGSSLSTFNVDLLRSLRDLPSSYPALQPLTEYIYGYAWNERDYLQLIRKTIGIGQSIARELDPSKPHHIALALDAASVFSVGLAECVGIVFTHYLQPDSLDQLDEALKVVIWGGRSQYEFIAKLRGDLMKAKGIRPSQKDALALPSWASFIQLIRNMLEAPAVSFQVPRLLRLSALDVLESRELLSDAKDYDLLAIKFCMLTFEYYCRVSGFPRDVVKSVTDSYIKLQSDIAQSK